MTANEEGDLIVAVKKKAIDQLLTHIQGCPTSHPILTSSDWWIATSTNAPKNTKAIVVERFLGRIASVNRMQRQLALGLKNTSVYESFIRDLIMDEASGQKALSVVPERTSETDISILALRQQAARTNSSLRDIERRKAQAYFQVLLVLSCANFLKEHGKPAITKELQAVSTLSKYGDDDIGRLLQGAAWAKHFVVRLVENGWSAASATELFVLSATAPTDWRHFRDPITEEIQSRIAHLKCGPGHTTRYTVPGLIVKMFEASGAIPREFSVHEVYFYFGLKVIDEDPFRVTDDTLMNYTFENFTVSRPHRQRTKKGHHLDRRKATTRSSKKHIKYSSRGDGLSAADSAVSMRVRKNQANTSDILCREDGDILDYQCDSNCTKSPSPYAQKNAHGSALDTENLGESILPERPSDYLSPRYMTECFQEADFTVGSLDAMGFGLFPP